MGTWLVWIGYTALLTVGIYSEAVHHQRGKQEWVGEYTREHGVAVSELREVKDPLKGYLRKESTQEERAYYQAAMYAQSIAEWRPLKTGVELWARWAIQWLLIPGIGITFWKWFRRRDSRGLPELKP